MLLFLLLLRAANVRCLRAAERDWPPAARNPGRLRAGLSGRCCSVAVVAAMPAACCCWLADAALCAPLCFSESSRDASAALSLSLLSSADIDCGSVGRRRGTARRASLGSRRNAIGPLCSPQPQPPPLLRSMRCRGLRRSLLIPHSSRAARRSPALCTPPTSARTPTPAPAPASIHLLIQTKVRWCIRRVASRAPRPRGGGGGGSVSGY